MLGTSRDGLSCARSNAYYSARTLGKSRTFVPVRLCGLTETNIYCALCAAKWNRTHTSGIVPSGEHLFDSHFAMIHPAFAF